MTDEPNHITDPGQLLAAIPAMMGFVPGESCIVIYGSENGSMQGAVLVSLTAPEDEIQEMAAGIDERGADLCVVVLVTPSPKKAVGCLDWLMKSLTTPVLEILGASSLEPGAEYVNPLEQSIRGRIPDWRESLLTTESVAEGLQIFSSEAELAATYAPATPVEKVRDLGLAECATLLTRLADALVNADRTVLPSPGQIGSVLIYGENSRGFTIHCAFHNPKFAHNIFSETSKYVRGGARVEALTLAGITAYISKQGSLAQAAFKAAAETATLMDPPYESELLELSAETYFSGAHPDQFKEAFLSALGETP